MQPGASAPELAGTVDSADRGDAESAEVGVQIVIHERAVAVDLRSEILAASLAAPADEPEPSDEGAVAALSMTLRHVISAVPEEEMPDADADHEDDGEEAPPTAAA